MSHSLKNFIKSQFGIGEGDTPADHEDPTARIDPEAARLAYAEIGGSDVIAARRDALLRQSSTATQNAMAGDQTQSPVDIDGNVNFELLFSQAGLQPEAFTADQAAKVIINVEKTIPAIISDQKQRNDMLRGMLLATMTGPAAPERVVYDAKNRSDALTDFMRARLDMAANFKEKAADAIKDLEEQIAAKKASIETADNQFSALASNCKERQAQYVRVIDLFSDPDEIPPGGKT